MIPNQRATTLTTVTVVAGQLLTVEMHLAGGLSTTDMGRKPKTRDFRADTGFQLPITDFDRYFEVSGQSEQKPQT